MESAPARRGRPKKIPGSLPVKRERQPKEVIPGSAPARRGRPPKSFLSDPLKPVAEQTTEQTQEPAEESTEEQQGSNWKRRQAIEDALKYHIIFALQRIGQLREIEEKGSTPEIRRVASKYVELLLETFVYPCVELFNTTNQYNTVEDDYPLIDDDGEYDLEDDTTVDALDRRINAMCDIEEMKTELIDTLAENGVRASFQ